MKIKVYVVLTMQYERTFEFGCDGVYVEDGNLTIYQKIYQTPDIVKQVTIAVFPAGKWFGYVRLEEG